MLKPIGHATRMVLIGLAAVVLVGAAVWLNLPVHPARPAASPPSAGRTPPDLNPAAFKGRGELAFVQNRLLYCLDGSTGKVTELTDFGRASSPAWSPDGRWLAFRMGTGSPGGSSLWLVRRDGTQAHEVQGLPGPAGSFSWSPAGDELAVAQGNGLWLVPARGEPTRAAPGLRSPDGRFLAYTVTLPWTDPLKRSDALYTVAAQGGKPVQRLVAPRAGIELVAWWPDGRGLLYCLDPEHSASLAADGLGLWSLKLGGARPKLLATVTHQSWLSFSPQGRLLLVKGGLRIVWANKQLAVFDVTTSSEENLSNPSGKVALDPAFSPDGKRIAFVGAKDLGKNVWGFKNRSQLAAWVATRTLWIENADGSGAHVLLSAGTGAYQPAWSRDGKSILYVRAGALWIVGAAGGKPQRVAGLVPPGGENLFGFYGYVHYDDYAWYQP